MNPLTDHREFLKRSFSAGLGAVALPEIVLAKSQNGRIRHGAIGVGGMGWADVQQIAAHPDVEIAAICDIDTARMAAATKSKFKS